VAFHIVKLPLFHLKKQIFKGGTKLWNIIKKNSGDPIACSPGNLTAGNVNMSKENKKFSTVPMDWKEVYYTNCHFVSASNVDQELGWTRKEFKMGIKYAFLCSRRENNCIHIMSTTLII
jgi:hypothetical protein